MRYLINKILVVFVVTLLSLSSHGSTETPDGDASVFVFAVVILGNYLCSYIYHGFYSESDITQRFRNIEPVLSVEVNSGSENGLSEQITETGFVNQKPVAEGKYPISLPYDPAYPWLHDFTNKFRHSKCQKAYPQMVIDNLSNDEISTVYMMKTAGGGSGGGDRRGNDGDKKKSIWDIYNLKFDPDSEDSDEEDSTFTEEKNGFGKFLRLTNPAFIRVLGAINCNNCNPAAERYCPLHLGRPTPRDEQEAFAETLQLMTDEIRQIEEEIKEARNRGKEPENLIKALAYLTAALKRFQEDERKRLERSRKK